MVKTPGRYDGGIRSTLMRCFLDFERDVDRLCLGDISPPSLESPIIFTVVVTVLTFR